MRRLLLLTCLVAGAAWADVTPPDTDGCSNRTEDAGCKKDDQTDGFCAKSSCTKLDYSHGTPPTSLTYECLKCTTTPGEPTPDAGPTETDGRTPRACAAGGGSLLVALAALLSRRKK